MRWKPKDKTLWHEWFAWYPVYVSNTEIAWLEKVQRRLTYLWEGIISEHRSID
jgi:hypothetical protein